jgi:heme A synthase
MLIIRNTAYIAAGIAYLLIVFGGIVRITGSGMGCGDDWPLCNGSVIPNLRDLATVIEFGHRVAALAVSALVVSVAALALLRRGRPGGSGPGGTLRPALLAVALLAAVAALGAVTVKLELPPASVVLHLGAAMALLAALVVAGLRAGRVATRGAPTARSTPITLTRSAHVALWLGAGALLLGALTANLEGAAGACLGFPLCSGQVWPTAGEGGLAHVHWTHRLIAYALALHLVGMVFGMRRRAAPTTVARALWVAVSLTVLQVVVGAAMVLNILQPTWRAAHLATGTAVWAALVVVMWHSRHAEPELEPADEPATGAE